MAASIRSLRSRYTCLTILNDKILQLHKDTDFQLFVKYKVKIYLL
jgi:hypothetical protein